MRSRQRSLQVGSLLLALSGCATWHHQALEPRTLIERDQPKVVRVTRTDRSQVVLLHPTVAGDSLRGSSQGREYSMPLSDISSVSVERFSPAGFAVGVLVVGGLVALMVAGSSFTILGD